MIGRKIMSEVEDRINDSNVKGYVQDLISKRTSSSGARRLPWLVAGLALGAAAMYLLDPEKGRSRRDAIKSKTNDLTDTLVETGSDLYDGAKTAAQSVYSKVVGASDEAADVVDTGITKAKAGVREANASARNAANSAKSALQ